MKKILTIILLVLIILGMITPMILADNDTENITNNITENNTIIDDVIDFGNTIIEYDLLVISDTGTNVIFFENNKKYQTNQINIVSGSKRLMTVDCKPHNDNNDLCDYLIYQQNVVVDKSTNIIQQYEVALLLPDDDEYSSELIFSDEGNLTNKIIVNAVPKENFTFNGTINIFGKDFIISDISLIFSFIISFIIFSSIEFKVWKSLLLILFWVALSFIIFMIISTI